MSGRLEGLEPSKVFRFFEEICSIPHGSYHVDEISRYLEDFAVKRNLKVIRDKENNVIIYRDASKGYEEKPVTILQGHMDMVAVNDDPEVDMDVTPLDVCHDGEYIYAKGSSLGGDDGIAVAYMLAILDDDSIKAPALEAVFTTNEEVGMDGAIALDASFLKGKRLINLDSEEEGIFIAGCAGGIKMKAGIELAILESGVASEKVCVKVSVSGLLGGHSGEMIIKNRANAIKICGRLLCDICDRFDVDFVDIKGGTKSNAIADKAEFEILVNSNDISDLKVVIADIEHEIKNEYSQKDDGIKITVSESSLDERSVFTGSSLKKLASFIMAMPDGVQAMCGWTEGLPLTSLNVGIIERKDNVVYTYHELRSQMGSSLRNLNKSVTAIADAFGAVCENSAQYPEWEYRESSPLRDEMCRIYKEIYSVEPKIEVIHAGLECGILAQKIEGFDAVSIGPDILDIHTTKEKLSIKSTERVWEYLLKVLSA